MSSTAAARSVSRILTISPGSFPVLGQCCSLACWRTLYQKRLQSSKCDRLHAVRVPGSAAVNGKQLEIATPSTSSARKHNRTPELPHTHPSKERQVSKTLNAPVISEDIQELYNALSTPPQPNACVGPNSVAATKLDPDYLLRLKLSFSDTSEKDQRNLNALRRTAASSLKRRNVSLVNITEVIHVNALSKRPREAQMAFDMIEENGMKPDLIAFNHLMDAYARADCHEQALAVFQTLDAYDLKPDAITYGILVHSCIKHGDLRAGFKLYDRMKAAGIQPTQPVFTSLIKGCLQAGDTARAWKTFNYMRSEICAPDEVTYSLMIHACSKAGDTERALDLFQEMAERGLMATEVTFTSLIQACATRSDYYPEAFELLGQMAAQGFTPNLYTYNVLLKGAAKQGDIMRARLIWNDLVERAEAEGEESKLKPTGHTFTYLLRTYAHAVAISRRSKRCTNTENGLNRHIANTKVTTERRPTASEGESRHLSTGAHAASDDGSSVEAVPSTPCTLSDDTSEIFGRTHSSVPRLTSVDTTPKVLLEDAKTIWRYLTTSGVPTVNSANDHTHTDTSPQPVVPVTSHILDAYLSVLCANPANAGALPLAIRFFNEEYQRYGVEPGGQARSEVLALVTRDKRAMETWGQTMWDDFLKWDAEKEAQMMLNAPLHGDGLLTEGEKEIIRKREARGKMDMFRNFVRVVNGYTRIGDLDSALRTISESHRFRSYYFLPQIQFSDVWSLVIQSRDLAEDGKHDIARRLLELCPRPVKSPLDEVQRRLKAKYVGGGWWGWEALGLQQEERIKVAKLQKRQNRERLVKLHRSQRL
ncbi:pentatricopeptide repeat domain-containing protein [Spizellomyces punctatus DAOM BR117]|uniref:Pentatricopeptide repeat domain-containing protein n=1 Tax=Spizellomyces punctatus (strain DAOM BR117) TaxID=645134 RepID=A0A0L0HFL9_SPIPD|nr:pentatricopeptide repeat domain-containing protein [Spizellomyces punctatus DAOM BR117]KNC99719.1 pentatricopeptide repeat domain-containing protein [Spizellomyces punctatus DAOM BR117]|eukprot:XP_016607759.1 pentatricopeptide repeat domain-containing protein [Spizellomyces punctatus DAOM BR117]